jgi:deoxycytidylate deaminase
MPAIKKTPQRPELIFGLVGAVGTDLTNVEMFLGRELQNLGYVASPIRLIHLLKIFKRWEAIPTAPADDYINQSMDAGNQFREHTRSPDALAAMAVAKIRAIRRIKSDNEEYVLPNTAFILRSLKNPAEVETLRTIYGESFILIAAYSSHAARLRHLTKRITQSRSSFSEEEYRHVAEQLIERDQEEPGNKLGQNVRDTFHRADIFVDATNKANLEESIIRFVRLLFGDTFKTPTRDEYCMFLAKAAALRSAEMGRQVGAVISTTEGEALSIGTNEVPKAQGGFYWEGDDPDLRDFQIGRDSNDEHKISLLGDILKRLSGSGLLKEELSQAEINKMVEDAVAGKSSPLIRGAQLMNLIEFGRAVHAEMAAITNAAKLGVAVKETTMHVTTFPCHMCARHIVSSGIRRVVYIEPYSKSLARQLYPDSIEVDDEGMAGAKVKCEPFVGVGPRRYMQWFAMLPDRKNRNGTAKLFKKKHAWPRCLSFPASYILEEKETLAKLRKRLQDSGLAVAGDNHDEISISANSRQSRRRIKTNSATLTKSRERRKRKRDKQSTKN